jgi:two-component system, chemotaxis family, CheB/CheR fusion protein
MVAKKTSKKDNLVSDKDLIVVGIGASAGGLEALQTFFKAMPEKTGMAFVVIQHLSPDYKSLMDELLARYTKIPIHISEDGMELKPDNIYLIPPRKNLSIFHNKLYLEPQDSKKGLNLPVDIFFRSLAKEKTNKAIGIILSGTGSDGTLGTKAIKETGG